MPNPVFPALACRTILKPKEPAFRPNGVSQNGASQNVGERLSPLRNTQDFPDYCISTQESITQRAANRRIDQFFKTYNEVDPEPFPLTVMGRLRRMAPELTPAQRESMEAALARLSEKRPSALRLWELALAPNYNVEENLGSVPAVALHGAFLRYANAQRQIRPLGVRHRALHGPA